MTTPDTDPRLLAEVRQMMAEAKPESLLRLMEDLRKAKRYAEGRPNHDA